MRISSFIAFASVSFFILLLSPAIADQLEVHIHEEGKVISFYGEYYVTQVNGSITIRNPYNHSIDYIQLPYDVGTLSIMDATDTGYVGPLTISFPYLNAGQTISFDYYIRGISATDPMYGDNSVLRTGFMGQQPSLFPPLIQNIKKAPVENTTVATDQIVAFDKRRIVEVNVENPSQLAVNISTISVIKTPSDDPNDELDRWDFPEGQGCIHIPAGGVWSRDIRDDNSSEGQVYWLSVGIIPFIEPWFNDTHNIIRLTQEDVYRAENSTVNENESEWNMTSLLEHYMYIKKAASKTLLMPGDIVDMSIRVNNFAPRSRNITLSDTIPDGFEFIPVEGSFASLSMGNTLVWTHLINPDSSRTFQYKLRFIDNESLGVDYFDAARLDYANETLYSQRIPYIRQYVPEKKIFIQKMLSYGLDDEIKVRIQVQNLGQDSINDMYVKEFLTAADDFREISRSPEQKGVWKIPVLKRNEIWEVGYVTNENAAANRLPEVYGISNKQILKTLIFENVIRSRWELPSVNIIEYIGIGLLIVFPIAFIIFNRRRRYRKERDLRALGSSISRLREDSRPSTGQSIDFLRKEAGVMPKLPDTPAFDGSHAHPSQGHHGRRSLKDMAKDNLSTLQKIDEETAAKKVR